MSTSILHYRAGYKYQTAADFTVHVPIIGHCVNTAYLRLTGDGTLLIRSGYCWDGASGPTIDTRNSQRASLVHDALYQLMRLGLLDARWRATADDQLRRLLLADGMSAVRAWLWWRAVSKAAGAAIRPSRERPILAAP
jgi:hypothetical protein